MNSVNLQLSNRFQLPKEVYYQNLESSQGIYPDEKK